tara:strand:+ start:2505 stop:2810 length:306 start_codon:yes stop_codon:yes gene_type:complete
MENMADMIADLVNGRIKEIPEPSEEQVEAFNARCPEFVGKEFTMDGERVMFVGYNNDLYYEPVIYKNLTTGAHHYTSMMAMHLAKGITIGFSDGTSQHIKI